MQLVGGLGTDVAPQLMARYNTGILIYYGNAKLRPLPEDMPVCQSPFVWRTLWRHLEVVISIIETGKATPPFPEGLIVI